MQHAPPPPREWQLQLVEAAAGGQHEVLAHLLQQQSQGMSNKALCHALGQAQLAAAGRGQQACCHLVLTAAAALGMAQQVVEARDAACFTPLMLAAKAGHNSCIPTLLAHVPTAQLVAMGGKMTALMHAAAGGHADCVKSLLIHIPEVQLTAVGVVGWTALHFAVCRGHLDCAVALLTRAPKAQLRATDIAGQTALHLAAQRGHNDCMEAVSHRFPEVQLGATDAYGRTALHLAARKGLNDCIEALLHWSPEVQLAATDDDRRTALHLAAKEGHADCITALLGWVPEVQLTATERHGHTALQLAACGGHLDCIAALLKREPEVQLKAAGMIRLPAFACAISEGHAAASAMLLKRMADLHLPARVRCARWGLSTPLVYAVVCGTPAVVRLLLSHQPATQERQGELDRALLVALCADQGGPDGSARATECVQLLLSSGARLDTQAVGYDQLWPILHDLAGRSLDCKAWAATVNALHGLAEEVRSQQARITAAHATQPAEAAVSSSSSSGGVRDTMGACTEALSRLHSAAAAPAPEAGLGAQLVQVAAQGNMQRLQRLLSFRDPPQPHLDQALIAALPADSAAVTARSAEASASQRQRCAVLLMARGARLGVEGLGQAAAPALTTLWPAVKEWAAAAYTADAATQAVQGC